ncbi:hypothetical protein [Candidatus Nitrosotenuis cloacae]|uniref:hypothetical protein n=1 Tax=Candidatus Nitrosotenuis cloacae TaxID=1603555 RepID=UPI0022819FDF|nr:hypothetical protein [Candidatus Nitrosotenuis cloacae]
MTEKYINRLTKEEEEENARKAQNDEWSHITGVGTKIEALDPLSVSDRTIIFGKDKSSSKAGVVKEKSEEFMDQMNNTNQYLKFINAHLVEKKNKINMLKEQERKFKEEVAALQNNTIKPREELERVNCKYITENDKESLLAHIEKEQNVLREKLLHHTMQIEKINEEIRQKDEQIAHIRNEIETIDKNATSTPDPLKIIEMELERLGIKDDSKIRQAMSQLKR